MKASSAMRVFAAILIAWLAPAVCLAAGDGEHAGFLSILPPLLAIVLALAIRQVIPALFLGVWFGAWALAGLDLKGLWTSLLDSFSVFIREAMADADRAAIILFSMMIGGMVGIISRNGGMQGVVNHVIRWVDSARHASLATAGMGLAIFFDDYANSLVVGNTMRPVTDRMRISREKLAYIVDSTAAPITCLALVTTWIGYEVGLIGDALERLGSTDVDAYAVFLNSIPYSFYPILAIVFVFMIAYSGRDFGPMLQAEQRARRTGVVDEQAHVSDEDTSAHETPIEAIQDRPHRAVNAILPIITLVVAVIAGLLVTGGYGEPGKSLQDVIGDADSYKALMWASLLGALVALLLSVGQRILTLKQAVDAWLLGSRSMFLAMVILVLAWALSAVADELGTADYLVHLLGDSLNPGIVPTLVFLLAAATAFATGSSWGSMGILMPLVIPLTWAILENTGADPASSAILFSTVSCVLAGAVWGDHCSPISDTTILSSMASHCDHIEHVRTQLPYAFVVGGVAIAVGTLPTGFGLPWWLGMIVAIALLAGILRLAGSPSEA